jgi:hypothetical protein
MAIIDVAELNVLSAIAERLESRGLELIAGKLKALIAEDLRPLSDLVEPKAARFGRAQPPPAGIRCGVEGCQNDSGQFFNSAHEGAPPIWVCRDHIPPDILRAGFPHPPIRDPLIAEAWRKFFKREDPAQGRG